MLNTTMELKRTIRHEIESRQYEVLEELQLLAQPHADASNGLFTTLAIDPELYPAQSLSNYKIDGSPQAPEVVKMVAESVEPRFGFFLSELDRQESAEGHLTEVADSLRQGHNIVLVTNHGDLKDIAYTLAAYYIKLKEFGVEAFHTSLVMSKIISFLGLEGETPTPAADVLKVLCDEQYFTFPRTRSIAESNVAKEVVDYYNYRAKVAMGWQLRRGKTLFAMAASGTTDKPLADYENITFMSGVGSGTAKLMEGKKSLVVPVAIWTEGEQMVFEPHGPREVSGKEEAHKTMRLIAHTLNERVDDRIFVYQYPDFASNVGKVAVENGALKL